ncbi:uncharacterized protein BO72DRAFT_494786 [Aspergillus fijiensis CBS 313.89]|uniref:Uncharacterized protein n=1 Tax=Aspergillus fijiensis CBS 313.89 TaxID=1448319 RepID=A0A8G1W124_9EURO|nr:uncharacterized protein BO72DRAFT_494786 [Aspergillus fijiensis CBS 313.89]RAK78946.1 hypothetical protein BO72DRAFT_494786 [Aspergillus fijiensis CBS 313.89]
MSLITDDLLLKLWELDQTQQPEERASANSGRRGVDITVENMREGISLAVLVFHKAEASDRSPRAVERAEARAYDACVRCLEAHPDREYVYAFTTFGTRGRAWRCGRGEDFLTALFGSQGLGEPDQYIEVHSPEARRISQAVRMMRAALPDY